MATAAPLGTTRGTPILPIFTGLLIPILAMLAAVGQARRGATLLTLALWLFGLIVGVFVIPELLYNHLNPYYAVAGIALYGAVGALVFRRSMIVAVENNAIKANASSRATRRTY